MIREQQDTIQNLMNENQNLHKENNEIRERRLENIQEATEFMEKQRELIKSLEERIALQNEIIASQTKQNECMEQTIETLKKDSTQYVEFINTKYIETLEKVTFLERMTPIEFLRRLVRRYIPFALHYRA